MNKYVKSCHNDSLKTEIEHFKESVAYVVYAPCVFSSKNIHICAPLNHDGFFESDGYVVAYVLQYLNIFDRSQPQGHIIKLQ